MANNPAACEVKLKRSVSAARTITASLYRLNYIALQMYRNCNINLHAITLRREYQKRWPPFLLLYSAPDLWVQK
jgi:hypothetical protein